MISRHRLDYRTGFLTPKCPQSREITSLTPLTPLRAREARVRVHAPDARNAHTPHARAQHPRVTRDPVIGVILVISKGLRHLGVRYSVRWGEKNATAERAAS